MHAQWTQNPANSFTVTFEEHGGTTVPDSTFVSGGTVTLPAAPTRAGFTFDGWFTAQTGGTKYGPTFSPSDGNLVVHAQWTLVTVSTTVMTAISTPTTGNDFESLLLTAFVLMVVGFFTVNLRRLKTN